MAKISILMFQEPGHLIPTLRVAGLLRSRGHEICYLVMPRLVDFIRQRGFKTSEILRDLWRNDRSDDALFDDALPGMDMWRRLAQRFGCALDLVGLPATIRASAMTSFIVPLVETRPDIVMCDSKIVSACEDLLCRSVPGHLVAISTELPRGYRLNVPELVLCPEELELTRWRQPTPGRRYCEPSIVANRDGWGLGVDPNMDSHPLIYCSFGSQSVSYDDAPWVLQMVIDAFADTLDVQVLISASPRTRGRIVGSLPRNVRFETVVDQLQVLNRTSVAILHGGLGSIKECIMSRVPMVIVPFYSDQRANAARVSEHGLGERCSPHDCDARAIRRLVDRIISRRRAQSLEAMHAVFAEREGSAPAVEYLDKLAYRCCSGDPTETL